jgi:hypothetical protein
MMLRAVRAETVDVGPVRFGLTQMAALGFSTG